MTIIPTANDTIRGNKLDDSGLSQLMTTTCGSGRKQEKTRGGLGSMPLDDGSRPSSSSSELLTKGPIISSSSPSSIDPTGHPREANIVPHDEEQQQPKQKGDKLHSSRVNHDGGDGAKEHNNRGEGGAIKDRGSHKDTVMLSPSFRSSYKRW